MSIVRLGNSQAVHHGTGEQLAGDRVTEAVIPDWMDLDTAVASVTHRGTDTQGVWAMHSAADAPDWVASDDPDLAARLGQHYGCDVVDLADTADTDGDGEVDGDSKSRRSSGSKNKED